MPFIIPMVKKKLRKPNQQTVALENVGSRILLIRGHKVILDSDLAELYGVTTGNLNKAVTRNINRFPEDFMFRLTADEFKNLIFQSGRSSWGGSRKLPRAFTQEGLAMLSGVLKTQRAVLVNVALMRAFVKLRKLLATNKDLAQKLDSLEKNYDAKFRVVFEAIRKLMAPEDLPRQQQIGFQSSKRAKRRK